ncbi:MAG: ABC transporter ATP-binding protein [Clostridia bacterium]|nr:ABC transporter ATP-binding protein [Clostridia bacterium]
MLECIDLVKRYKGYDAVSGLSFAVHKGEVLGLLGPNGAGKTTTIKMILGLATVTRGEVRITSGVRIGYSPETPYFHPFLTGFEVMIFFSKLQGMDRKTRVRQIEEILEMVGLREAGDKKVKVYSKGMLQRLAVAQALLGKPDILILDEPTSGLDALGRVEMIRLINRLKSEGKTIILNSHILSDVQKVADRAVIIQNGTKVKEIDFRDEHTSKDLESTFIEVLGGAVDDSIDYK